MKNDNLYDADFIQSHGNNWIHKTAIIGDNVKMGTGNVVMPYAVIGQPGFIRDADEHGGKVLIGDNNRFGCHCTVMTGEKGDTVIGSNNMVMNYVNIGHNVVMGDDCEIGPHSIIAGHAIIEDRVIMKLAVLIRNRIRVMKEVTIGMGSVVLYGPVPEGVTIVGNPATDKKTKP